MQVARYQPDIWICSETRLNDGNKEFAVLNGYKSLHVIRYTDSCGGVSVLFRESLNVEHLPDLSFCNLSIEICTIKVSIYSSVYYVVGIYRPHSGTVEELLLELTNVFEKIPHLMRCNVVLLGDMNLNLLAVDNSNVQSFYNFMRSNYFAPVINCPTRYDSDSSISPTLLDQIWINFVGSNYYCGAIILDQTDHCPVYINIKREVTDNGRIKIKFRNFSERNRLNFREKLAATDWDIPTTDVDLLFNSFDKKIQDGYNMCFPLLTKEVRCDHLCKPWITPAIKISIKRKSELFRLFKLGIVSKETNIAYRNMLRKIVRNAKLKYFKEYFDRYKSNMRKTWSAITNLIGSSKIGKKEVIKSLRIGNVISRDSGEIANHFSQYFASVAQHLDAELPPNTHQSYPLPLNTVCNSMVLFPVTNSECSNIISGLKISSQGINQISSYMLKEVKDCIVDPLTKRINLSFSTRVVPVAVKTACITPIHKSSDIDDVNNYRPISVIPLFAKVMEKCMFSRILKFVNKYDILSRHQFGFRSGLSCVDAIVSLNESIYEALNDRKYIIGLFVDLKKAYDTVNHSILLEKLHAYGIRGVTLNWFKNYLMGRKHRVKIGNNLSDWTDVTIGIPQGSVLGCILFLLYINDLPQTSSLLHTVLFADDTCFTLADSNLTNLINNFNRELNKFSHWLIVNRLTINYEKTVAINFSLKRAIDVSDLVIDNHSLKYVKSTKYLGVILDEALSFTDHINYIRNKISKNVGVLYRLSGSTPDYVLKSLYNSLVSPYLTYCNIIWGNAANTHLNKLLLLQKKAVRIISSAEYRAHSDPLFHVLGILRITEVYKYSCCMYVFDNKKIYDRNVNVYTTRNCNTFKVKFQRLDKSKCSVFHNSPKIFNSLPAWVADLKNRNSFKRSVREILLNSAL